MSREKRHKEMTITWDALTQLLQGSKEALWWSDLPEDVEIIGMSISPLMERCQLLLRSDAWPVIGTWDMPAPISPNFTTAMAIEQGVVQDIINAWGIGKDT